MNIYKNANILVAGGTGFVGVNLIQRLLTLGAIVRATIHKRAPVIENDLIEYVQADLTKPEDCRNAVEGIDYVFMCAANSSGAAVMEKTPLVHLTPNIVMNALMLEASYKVNVKKFLFVSSNTVYPLTDQPAKENDVTNEFYEKYFIVAWMKRFSEIMCEMYATKIKKPMTTIVVRPANIYGPYDDFEWETSHVLPALIRRVVERHDPIVVWGNGSDVKDFIYIDDVIEGMLLAMEEIDGYDFLNIASGKQYVLKDLLNIMISIDGYDGAVINFDASKPTMIPKRLIDTRKAKEILGFEAKTPIEEGIRMTIDWYRNLYDSEL
ncbi:MAG: NAD-dependent epimerase/dehydratase family protein [Desulfobacterales bacterium]|nr:NAD-dependent epimerase/dehydratase family protein [Desulfobacterales bacterium]